MYTFPQRPLAFWLEKYVLVKNLSFPCWSFEHAYFSPSRLLLALCPVFPLFRAPQATFPPHKIPWIWKLECPWLKSLSSGGLSNTPSSAAVTPFWQPRHWTQSLTRLPPDSAHQMAALFAEKFKSHHFSCINQTMPFMFSFTILSPSLVPQNYCQLISV